MRSSALVIVLFLGCSHSEPAPTAAASPAADAIASFETVRAVLQNPRCVNCHPQGDEPTQGDEGRVHDQFVLRGPEGKGAPGLHCATCHGQTNRPASYGGHMPPGVSTGWRLPPPEHKMVFADLSSSALCEQLKDPRRNGGKTLAELVHHVSSDPLVLWAWSPGYGRAAVPVPHAEFVRAVRAWVDAGGACAPARTAIVTRR